MPTLCPFLKVLTGWPAVCNCGIAWLYSIIFGTIIIVDDNTSVLH